jgi:acetyltransferase-like isoleucine patch superfamily enzyme
MKNLILKAFWLLKYRPRQLKSAVRSFVLFSWCSVLARALFGPKSGITLGPNVRLQTLGGLLAERPEASIQIGANSIVYEKAKIEAYGKGRIEIAENSVLGDVRIYAREKISIGARLVSSWNVFIQDFDPHPISPEERAIQVQNICADFRPQYASMSKLPLAWDFPTAPIELGDDIWIGANVTILKGVKIGSGCLIATGSVVTSGEYPARSILAGNPARVVKTI